MTTEVDDFLAHYGVPGMKWGRRRTVETPSSTQSKTSLGLSETRKKQIKTAAVVGGVLAAVAVGSLVTVHASKVNSGKKIVNDLIKSASKQDSNPVASAKRYRRNIEGMTKEQATAYLNNMNNPKIKKWVAEYKGSKFMEIYSNSSISSSEKYARYAAISDGISESLKNPGFLKDL